MIDDFLVQPLIGVEPDLPAGYVGYFELRVSTRWRFAETVLNLFAFNLVGKMVFVRSFHGLDAEICQTEFDDWLMGMYDTPLIG